MKNNIIRKEENGMVSVVICLFAIMIFIILLYSNTIYNAYKSTKVDVQDALMSSTIAAVVIDLDEFDKYDVSVIDVDKAYEIFSTTMEGNMSHLLGNENVISFRIEKLCVYNVYSSSDTRVYTYNTENGSYSMLSYDSYIQLDGKQVVSSTIYAEISFDLPGIFNSENIEQHFNQSISFSSN